MVQTKRSIKPFGFFFNTKGQNADSGVFYIQPDSADIIQNLNVDAVGQWSANNQGYSNFTAALESGADIDALTTFTDTSSTQYLLAVTNGKVKNLNTSTGAVTSEISTSFTAGQPVDFAALSGNLFAVSQSLTPQKWTGSGSMSAATGWPLVSGNTYDKPKVVEKYVNRLVFANFNGATAYPSHMVISDDLAPETFTVGSSDTNAVILQVAPGDGQTIVGLLSYYLPTTNSEILFIFKEHSIYTLEGDTPSTFEINLLNGSIGAVNNRCIVQVGSDVLFLGEGNVYNVSTASQSGTIQPKAIGSDKVKDVLATINLEQLAKCWAVHLPDRREVWFGIPTGANTDCNTILQYSYRDTGNGPLNAWSVRVNTTQRCATLLNRVLYTGDSVGYVNAWHSSNTYAGTSVAYKYRYPFFNFGTQAQNKRILECYAWLLLSGTHTVSIKSEWRGGGNNIQRTVSQTLTLGDGSSSVYGGTAPPAAVYGTNLYGTGTILKKVRIPILGNGEQVQLTISGNTTDEAAPIFLGFSGLVEFMGYSRRYN